MVFIFSINFWVSLLRPLGFIKNILTTTAIELLCRQWGTYPWKLRLPVKKSKWCINHCIKTLNKIYEHLRLLIFLRDSIIVYLIWWPVIRDEIQKLEAMKTDLQNKIAEEVDNSVIVLIWGHIAVIWLPSYITFLFNCRLK